MEYHLCHQEMEKVVKGKALGPDAKISWLDINKIIETRRQDPRFNNLPKLS